MPVAEVCVSDLLDPGDRRDWHESLALVLEVAAAASASGWPGDASGFRLTAGGTIRPPRHPSPIAAGSLDPIRGLAELLRRLLPRPGQAVEPGVPPGLRYTIIRAIGGVTAPPFQSLEEFSSSLSRFEQEDRRALLKALHGRAAVHGQQAARARLAPLRWDEVQIVHPGESALAAPGARDQAAARPGAVPAAKAAGAPAGPLLIGFAAVSMLAAAAVVAAAVVVMVGEPERSPAWRVIAPLLDGRNYHPRLAPDGSKVAFDSDRDGVRGVYASDRDGRPVTRVSGEGDAAIPSWSADGRQLAFVKAEPGDPRVWNVWALDLASGEAVRLTSYHDGQTWGASWLPDSRRICYSHDDRLIVLDTASGELRTYLSPRRGIAVRTPAVSPDGRLVIFQLYRDGAWLLDLGNDKMRKVLDDPTAGEFSWSPDGSRVAYHSGSANRWSVWRVE